MIFYCFFQTDDEAQGRLIMVRGDIPGQVVGVDPEEHAAVVLDHLKLRDAIVAKWPTALELDAVVDAHVSTDAVQRILEATEDRGKSLRSLQRVMGDIDDPALKADMLARPMFHRVPLLSHQVIRRLQTKLNEHMLSEWYRTLLETHALPVEWKRPSHL